MDREPLIAPSQQHHHHAANINADVHSDDIEDVYPHDCAAQSSNSSFIWLLTLAAGVSGLLFGYDTGIISSTLVSISTSLSGRPLTTLDKSLITSSTSLFALIASPITGTLADAFGRRAVIFLASLLFAIGAVLQAISNQVWLMIIGRSVVGLGVGSASFVVPLYVAELSPASIRGKMVTINCLLITGGQVIAYLVGWAFSETVNGWRWMVGLGAFPAILQLVLLFAMPETPRWLIKVGRDDTAKQVLTSVYGVNDPQNVQKVFQQIRTEVDTEESLKPSSNAITTAKSNIEDLFQIGSNRRALTIACLLQGSQQLCGFNSLMYFSASIFSLVGFRSPTLTSLSVALTNLLFTLIAFVMIDRIGRRRILLLSIPIMAVGMIFAAICFRFLDINMDVVTANTTFPSTFWSYFLIASTMLYVAFYALSLGNVPWQQSELFPLSVRSLGSGLATATNWASNFIIGLTFLPMMELLTPSGAFSIFAIICLVAWIAIYSIYPETAGLELEDVGGLLANGYGVRESVQRWKARWREGGVNR